MASLRATRQIPDPRDEAPVPVPPVGGDEAIERAVEWRTQAIYPAELLVLQPFEQAMLKLLWLLPAGQEFGFRDLVAVIQQLGWRTGNGRVAGEKAVRASLHAIADAGWVQITQDRRPNGTRAPQRYRVFENRRNNPDWSGESDEAVLAFTQVRPHASLGEVVRVEPVDNGVYAGQSTWPIAACRNAASGDGVGGSEGVYAGQSTWPIGAGGSVDSPHTPLGGGGTPPPPVPQTGAALAARSGVGEEELSPRNTQAIELLASLGEEREELVLGRRDVTHLLPLVLRAFDEGWLPMDLRHELLSRRPNSGVGHAGGFVRSRLENLPLRPRRGRYVEQERVARVPCEVCGEEFEAGKLVDGSCPRCWDGCRVCGVMVAPKVLDGDQRCPGCRGNARKRVGAVRASGAVQRGGPPAALGQLVRDQLRRSNPARHACGRHPESPATNGGECLVCSQTRSRQGLADAEAAAEGQPELFPAGGVCGGADVDALAASTAEQQLG
jgi:hypothetical protein